jgi:hypothetical protein
MVESQRHQLIFRMEKLFTALLIRGLENLSFLSLTPIDVHGA